MEAFLSDIGYIWDELKFALVQQEHDVEFYEVIQAFEDPHALDEPDPQGNWGRYMVIGRTLSQRILQIIYSDEDLSLTRLITAFDANDYWSTLYEQRD